MSSLDGLILRLWFAVEFARFIDQQPRPDLSTAAVAEGPDPIRVLITGAGLGVGYGVQTTEDALSGQLASALHASLHRGVSVDSQVGVARPLRRTTQHMREQPPHPYDVVVYTPAFGEVNRGGTASWSRQLEALIDALRTDDRDRPSLILTGLPTPRVHHRIERITLERAARVNRVLQHAASGPSVAYAAPPTYPTPSVQRVFDQEYYRRFAASVALEATSLLAEEH